MQRQRHPLTIIPLHFQWLLRRSTFSFVFSTLFAFWHNIRHDKVFLEKVKACLAPKIHFWLILFNLYSGLALIEFWGFSWTRLDLIFSCLFHLLSSLSVLVAIGIGGIGVVYSPWVRAYIDLNYAFVLDTLSFTRNMLMLFYVAFYSLLFYFMFRHFRYILRRIYFLRHFLRQ